MVRKAKESTIDIEELPELIPPIFQQAQLSLANHRKNVVSLHKLHEQAAQITQTLGKGKGIQLTGEAAFSKAFISMVNRILPIKKGVSQADKSIKFVAAFVRYTSEKGESAYFIAWWLSAYLWHQLLKRSRRMEKQTRKTQQPPDSWLS